MSDATEEPQAEATDEQKEHSQEELEAALLAAAEEQGLPPTGQAIPPEEVIHRAISRIDIETSPDGAAKAITFAIPAPHKAYTFMLPTQAAEDLGRRLTGKAVEVPKPALLVPEGAGR